MTQHFDLHVCLFLQNSAVKTHDIIQDDGYFNRTFSSESLDRSTNQLINFNQSVMEEKSDVIYDEQWEQNGYRDKTIPDFSEAYDDGVADSGFIRNVSRKRIGKSSKVFDPLSYNDVKTKPKKIGKQKSYYYEADDVSFDDVASDVTLLRWSERTKDLPVESSSGSELRDGLKRRWGNPPMPVTFYNKRREPFTVI